MPVAKKPADSSGSAVQFAQALAAARSRSGLTQDALALLSNIPQGQISKFETNKAVPDIIDVTRLEAGLGLQRGQLLVEGGLVEVPDPEAAIAADKSLLPAHRAQLVDQLAFFRDRARKTRK